MSDFKVTDEDLKEAISKALNGQKYNLYGLIAEDLHTALIALTNHLNSDEIFNANVLISAEDINAANAYGNILAEALKSIFNKDMCASPIEDNLYDWENLREKNRDINALLVENAKIQDPEQLFETLTEFEKKGFNPAVIICTDNETVERLKQFDKMDYRLYHYLCGSTKIFVPGINKDNIAESAFKELGKKGLELTDVFKEKTKIYVEAVYPEASLTKEPFLEDLITRIITERNKKTVELNKILDETDVPFSEKAEKLWEIRQNEKTEENLNPQKGAEVLVEETNFPTTEDDSKNVLILAMSTLPNNKRGAFYSIVEKDKKENKYNYQIFKGISQLEPGTKLFISNLAESGKKPDKIIILTTSQAINPDKKYDDKSAIEVYSANILSYLKNGDDENEIKKYCDLIENNWKDNRSENISRKRTFEKIKEVYSFVFDEENCQDEDNELENLCKYVDVQTVMLPEKSLNSNNDVSLKNPLKEIMNILYELAKDKHVNLFVDLQGGIRTFMFTLFATLTLLRDKNVSIKDMFAIKFDLRNALHPIEIENREYAIIDLVSGIRSFSRYGKIGELKKFIESRKISGSSEKELLSVMEKIDGYMQINNPTGFSEEIKKITKLGLLEKYDNYDEQFQLIVEDLKSEYSPLLKKHTVLDEIKWLGDKEFTSSALTFIEDKIPAFLLDKDNFFINVSCEKTDDEIVKDYSGQPYYRRQNNLFNAALDKTIIKGKVEKRILEDICAYWSEKISDELSSNYYLETYGWLKDSELNDEVEAKLLAIENQKGIEVWKGTLKDLLDCTVKYNKLEELKAGLKLNNEVKGDTQICDLKENKNEIYETIKNDFINDENNYKKAKVKLTYNYYKKKSWDFNNLTSEEKDLLKLILKEALYRALFKAPKGKEYEELINKFLKPLLEDKIVFLKNIQVTYDVQIKSTFFEQMNTSGRKIDFSEFIYNLWKNILNYIHNEKKLDIDTLVECHINTDEEIKSYENNLEVIYNKGISEKSSTDELLKYANNYIKCRLAKDNKEKNIKKENYIFSDNNIDIYLELDRESYKKIIENYFYFDEKNGIRLKTIAGVKNVRSFDSDLDVEILCERTLLETCINFYKALKNERNTTNHASEKNENHMNYKYTQKAISVFVELCKRLEKKDMQ